MTKCGHVSDVGVPSDPPIVLSEVGVYSFDSVSLGLLTELQCSDSSPFRLCSLGVRCEETKKGVEGGRDHGPRRESGTGPRVRYRNKGSSYLFRKIPHGPRRSGRSSTGRVGVFHHPCPEVPGGWDDVTW